jgi:hypothetical protein
MKTAAIPEIPIDVFWYPSLLKGALVPHSQAMLDGQPSEQDILYAETTYQTERRSAPIIKGQRRPILSTAWRSAKVYPDY